jgi:hypothetical protein
METGSFSVRPAKILDCVSKKMLNLNQIWSEVTWLLYILDFFGFAHMCAHECPPTPLHPQSYSLAFHISLRCNSEWTVLFFRRSTDYSVMIYISGNRNVFPIYDIYSNTLVHSSPHLPVYCMGRWVRFTLFFSNGNIKYDTTFYA